MSEPVYIAIDGGGTGSRAGLYDADNNLLGEYNLGASNPAQLGVDRAITVLSLIARAVAQSADLSSITLAVGLSGARDTNVRDTVARGLCGRLRVKRAVVTTDVHGLLFGNWNRRPSALVVAGTGSSVATINARGETLLVGGRGPVLGDEGSAYHLVTVILRAACRTWDEHGAMPSFMPLLADAAELKDADELVPWSVRASKSEIAALAPAVLGIAESELPLKQLVERCAASLVPILQRGLQRGGVLGAAPIYLAGGLFECSTFYRTAFASAVRAAKIEGVCSVAPHRGHRAVLELARAQDWPDGFPLSGATPASLESQPLSVTESRDAVSLDALDALDAVVRMNAHHVEAAVAVAGATDIVAALVERVAAAFRRGGRLVYLGAGTSGRLGVLDASECAPTFGTPEGQIIALIAGGEHALRNSVEGAEDSAPGGRADIESIAPAIGPYDVVVGVAASGTTPYTIGGLAAAKQLGAATAMVCCNPDAQVDVDYLVALATGPEALPGSTRLKAGTATKMVLNEITTCAMALSGRVFEGYMIGVNPANAKLRKRAARIIGALTGLDETAALTRLDEAGNHVDSAVIMERLQITADEAHALLERTRGNVRAALALHAELMK